MPRKPAATKRKPPEKLLTTNEAAEILGMHATSVSGAVRRGALKAARMGTSLRGRPVYLFRRSELDRYNNERSTASRSLAGKTRGPSARAVSDYLEAIALNGEGQPSRSLKTYERKIERLEAKVKAAPTAMVRLRAMQELLDVRNQRDNDRKAGLQEAFVANAGTYAQANGISYEAFRSLGVPAAVLKQAGVK